MSPGLASSILQKKQPCHDTVRPRKRAREKERRPVAGGQAGDSFAVLVGYSATMPSSFQSSIKEDAHS